MCALAAATEPDDLSRLFQGFSRAFDDVVRSGQPRAALETTLVRLARRPALLPLDDLLARLGDLERRLGGGSPTPPRSVGSGAGSRGGGPSPVSRGGGAAGSAWTPPVAKSEPATRGALALVTPVVETPHVESAPSPVAAEEPSPAPALPANVVPLKAPAASPALAPSGDLDALRAILDRVAQVRPGLRSVLEHAVPSEIGPARVTLLFEPVESQSFFLAQAQDPEAIAILTDAVRAHFGARTAVQVQTGARPAGRGTTTLAAIDAEARRTAEGRAREAVERHPLVAAAMRIFGAEIREVKPADGEE